MSAEEQQLATIEHLCTSLYTASDEQQRNAADAQLAGMFGTSNSKTVGATTVATTIVSGQGIASNAAAADISAIPRHEFVLSRSVNSFALHFSATALLQIVTSCWQSLNTEQRIQLRDFAFNCFVAKGPQLERVAVRSLITLTCRITKRGWCDNPKYHLVVTEMMKLLTGSNSNPFYQRLGLTFLQELVEEMQVIRVQGLRRSGRTAAIAFRDQGLREIFVAVKRLLQSLAPEAYEFEDGSDEERFLELALTTVLSCLCYDFDVSNPDRSNTDITTTRAPRSWSDTRDETTIGLFFEIYNARQNTRSSSLALESIGKLASLRRSLFTPEERQNLITRLQRETLSIMTASSSQNGTLWEDPDTLHSFCRLLGSLKLSFHLDEVVKPESYPQWIQALLQFSIQAFSKWDVVDDTALGYILSLWGALVHPLVDGAKQSRTSTLNVSQLGELVPQLMSSFINSRMEMASAIAQAKIGANQQHAGLENPLEQEGVPAQMVPIEKLSWLKYVEMAQFLTTLLDNTTHQLLQASHASTNEANVALAVAETRLSWLVHITASVIGAFASNVWTRKNVSDNINAELTSRVFRLLILICPQCANPFAYAHALNHFKIGQQNLNAIRPSPMRQSLELAMLEFVDQFRKLHIEPENPGMGQDLSSRLSSRLPRSSKAVLVRSLAERTISSMLARKLVEQAANDDDDDVDDMDDDDDMITGGRKNGNDGDSSMGGQGEQREQNTYTQLVNMIGMGQYQGKTTNPQDDIVVINDNQHIAVLDVIIAKLAFNLKAWSLNGEDGTTSTKLARRTLLVLHSMASGVQPSRSSQSRSRSVGFSTGEMLLQSRVLCNLLDNADINSISYFAHPSNGAERTVFFNALSHLLYMQMSTTAANLRFSLFARFVQPLEKVAQAMFKFVQDGNSLRNKGIRTAIAGWCRDVLGVCTASKTRENYALLFEWLVDGKPSKLQLLSAALTTWADDPFVTTPILKLVSDLVHNRTHRIVFAPSKASGYVLCRLAAQCVSAYGALLRQGAALPAGAPTPPSGQHVGIGLNPGENTYKKRYKGLGFCMHTLAHLLNGNYVNFGIMELYGDNTLSTARDAILQLVLSSDPNDILSYPKTTRAFFMLIDALAIKDVHSIVQLPSDMFVRLMTCVKVVLERPVEEAAFAASVVDRLVTYRFECQKCVTANESQNNGSSNGSDASTVQNIQKKHTAWKHFQQHHNHSSNIFDTLLVSIFQLVAFKNCTRQWSMSRPLLPLILSNPNYFTQYQAQVISQAPGERRQTLQAAFDKLNDNIDSTLSTKNRDRFTKNLYNTVRMIKE